MEKCKETTFRTTALASKTLKKCKMIILANVNARVGKVGVAMRVMRTELCGCSPQEKVVSLNSSFAGSRNKR